MLSELNTSIIRFDVPLTLQLSVVFNTPLVLLEGVAVNEVHEDPPQLDEVDVEREAVHVTELQACPLHVQETEAPAAGNAGFTGFGVQVAQN